jgi:hypothetical protein
MKNRFLFRCDGVSGEKGAVEKSQIEQAGKPDEAK